MNGIKWLRTANASEEAAPIQKNISFTVKIIRWIVKLMVWKNCLAPDVGVRRAPPDEPRAQGTRGAQDLDGLQPSRAPGGPGGIH